MPKAQDPVRRKLIEERRSQILTAALAVFARKGYERATIADIAREAGIAEGSIYNYFKNKADLLVSLPRQIIQPNVEAVSGRVLTGEMGELPPHIALPLMARTMLQTFRDNAPLFRTLLSALPALKPSAKEKYFQTILYVLGFVRSYFRRCIEKGIMRADLDVDVAALGFVGMFFPFVMLQGVLEVPLDAHYDDDRLINTLIQVFLDGVLAPGADARPAPEGTME